MKYKLKYKFLLLIILLTILTIFLLPFSLAHEEVSEISDMSLKFVGIAAVISIAFVLVSIFWKKRPRKANLFLFLGIILPIILVTIYLVVSTITLNIKSETKGPVHWHADFEIWNCGKQLDLQDPRGFVNRVGSELIHEHGDNRIHIEGVIIKKEDVSLHHFFEAVGGELRETWLTLPTNQRYETVQNGDACNNKPGKLQIFVYKVHEAARSEKELIYKQEKLASQEFVNYIISPQSRIPPGDCIILEFDIDKEKTTKLCETLKVAQEKNEIKIL